MTELNDTCRNACAAALSELRGQHDAIERAIAALEALVGSQPKHTVRIPIMPTPREPETEQHTSRKAKGVSDAVLSLFLPGVHLTTKEVCGRLKGQFEHNPVMWCLGGLRKAGKLESPARATWRLPEGAASEVAQCR